MAGQRNEVLILKNEIKSKMDNLQLKYRGITLESKAMMALTIFSFLLLSSCSFDNTFLQPTKLPPLPTDKENVVMSFYDGQLNIDFDTKTLQPTFLDNNGDTIHLNYTLESVVFKSSSGNNLNGWFLKPIDITPTTTLLHFHGNGGCVVEQFHAMKSLINYGFQALVFDYSGYGFSEGVATRDNVLLDGNAALTYIKGRDDVKNTKIVIYGQSLGGHLSAVVAEQRQDEIDGLVIEGAFSSHKDIAAEAIPILGRMIVSEKYSAYKSIQHNNKPVLVIHSTEDESIPLKLGQKIFEHANEPKEFYEIEKCHICGTSYYADSIAFKIHNMIK